MRVPQGLQDLLDKPMSRQQFLKHLGVGSLLLLGGGTIFRSLQGLAGSSNSGKQRPSSAYGSSVYGGASES